MKFFKTSDNQIIYYEDSGNPNGKPLVMIHGFPFSHEMWKPQLSALENDYRLLAIDLRGSGKSATEDGQFTMEMLADDLLALFTELRLEQAAVLAFSMGGYVALRALEKSPKLYSALILADTQSLPDSDEAKIKRTGAIKTIKEKGLGAFAEGFLKAATSPETGKNNPDLMLKLNEMVAKANPKGAVGSLLAMISRTDTTLLLEKISVPTLILVGDQDAITPLSIAAKMKEKIKGAELVVIPKAGHMSNWENTEAFNQALQTFLKKRT